MKIAIPVTNGRLSAHFGHCEQFALVDVDEGQAGETTLMTPPPHEPGALPRWLHEQGADLIVAGGMGRRAQQLFAENGIQVVVGAPSDTPENIVAVTLNQPTAVTSSSANAPTFKAAMEQVLKTYRVMPSTSKPTILAKFG